jgi:hypothetical protein
MQDVRVLRLKCLELERDLAITKNSGGSLEELKVTRPAQAVPHFW